MKTKTNSKQIINMMKQQKTKKNLDTYSFSPQKQLQSREEDFEFNEGKNIRMIDKIDKINTNRTKDIHYRHMTKEQKQPMLLTMPNKRIEEISRQLEANIRRRIELEHKANLEIAAQLSPQRINQTQPITKQSQFDQQANINRFVNMAKKVDAIQKLIKDGRKQDPWKTKHAWEQSEDINQLQQQDIKTQVQRHLQTKPLLSPPNPITIQTLLSKLTFPQLPKHNLPTLQKHCQQLLSLHTPHSDIHYLLMVLYFHLGHYGKTMNHFNIIIRFKIFNHKAYWIAAQASYNLQHYQECIQLTEKCLQLLSDRLLPRFVHLKALSYNFIGNIVNSLLCYNQLIKMKPKISQHYLQRSILNEKAGYFKQSKQDCIMFGLLNPEGRAWLQRRILGEKNDHKTKEYVRILSKMY